MSDETQRDSEAPEPEGASDRPPDFKRKRDQFLSKFAPGARLTDEMVAERDRLEEELHKLELENAQLRARVELDTAIVELLSRVEKLETEKRDLATRFEAAQRNQEPQHDDHFRRVEAEFTNLANLYVASNQLHSSLSPRRVARCIKEVLGQLLGAQSFCVYLASDDGAELVPIASEAVPEERLAAQPISGTALGEAFSGGRLVLNEEGDPSQGSFQSPSVVIPLSLDDHVVGVIVIFATLSQKTSFRTVDFELFKLLGNHAAPALVGASLFTAADRKLPKLQNFLDLSA